MSRPITVSDAHREEARELLIKTSNSYLRDVESDQENGYRPSHCFHGTSLWTDYDNICGPCEDSRYDPRSHSIDSEEFNFVVEEWATDIARERRYSAIMDMIKEESKYIESRSDLARLKILIDAALDI